MSEIDKNLNFGTIERINSAREAYLKSNFQKYDAIASLYAVYIDCVSDSKICGVVNAAYAALPNAPKTPHMSNKVLYLAFSSDKRRVSELHKLMVIAKADNKKPADIADWLKKAGGVRNALRSYPKKSGRSGTPKQRDLFSVAKALMSEANNKTVLGKAPVPVACETGEYFTQYVERQPDSTFVSVWVKVTKSGYEFLKSSPVVQSTAKAPSLKAYDDLVAEAELRDAA